MDKKRLHHLWTRIRPIKPWYFIVGALLSGTVCIIALRSNYTHMTVLRQQVYDADKSGIGVVPALQRLQEYVTSHMNTNLSGPNSPYPPVQLVYTYDRAVQAAGSSASAANSKIYTDAQHYCENQDSVDFSGHNRVPCVQQYIESHGVNLPTVPDGLYKFDFITPFWSPDAAGWSMVATIICLLAAILLGVVRWWLRRHVEG